MTGTPTFYEFKGTKKQQLQIVSDRASQIKLSEVPGLVKPSAATRDIGYDRLARIPTRLVRT